MKSTLERMKQNMTVKNKSGTYYEEDIDTEISDLLIAISVKTRRLAHKVRRLSSYEKMNKGGKVYGQRQRHSRTCRRT